MNKKLLLTWSDEKNIGIPILDEQHRGIVSLINSLSFVSSLHSSSYIVETNVEMIDKYIKLHGYTEEWFFQYFHYPDFEAHQGEHIRLIDKLTELRNESPFNPQDCAKRFMGYFISHTEKEDRKFVEFIKEAIAKQAASRKGPAH